MVFLKKNFITTEQVLRSCRQENRAALVSFLPAGFPDNKSMVQAAAVLIDNGVDILEIGVPYSDPVMDGVAIQAAAAQALKQGFKVRQIFEVVDAVVTYIKDNNKNVAVVVMTYWNPVLNYGVKEFARDLERVGGAGLITPDLNIDEAAEWIEASDIYGLDRIFLVAPSSNPQRINATAAASRGFVYAAAAMSITGKNNTVDGQTQDLVTGVRRVSDKYVCVGIGISTTQQAKDFAQYADGVIVGSKFVQTLAQSVIRQFEGERLGSLTRRLRDSVRR